MDKVMDGNKAAAHAAYAFSEVAAIYPITPASPMGEIVDEWASKGKKNALGENVKVIEMQSEAGAAGVVHGSLSAGALTTTFTASQGLLLMLPNMFKISGELLPTVFHIASRSLAYQSLSIFGDHSDVMTARGTGFGMLASASVQEVMDLAIIAHLSTLESRIPFMHFFDGFRTSHEIQKINVVDYKEIRNMINMKYIDSFRGAALNPERPYAKVGAENPDVYFQGREASNKYYEKVPGIVKKYMELFGEKTGRKYKLYEYSGVKDATKIVICMGSGCETVEETARYLNKKGKKLGVLRVRLYRPFSVKDFSDAIPKTVKKIVVLNRTKESGAVGEPLYLDVVSALKDRNVEIIGGRYGLSSKEFTPGMAKAVFDNKGFHDFTIGIEDDVTNKSIPFTELDVEPDTKRCKFWGLGSDGTVGANKNSIKIIGENTEQNVQAYFSYDSKKSGGITRSYLRFGKNKIKAPYVPTRYDFIALHNSSFIGQYDILEGIKDKGVFLINCSWKPEEVMGNLTKDMQKTILDKKIKVHTIDAKKIAKEVGLGNRISTVMQAAFFKISGILPEAKAIKLIKDAIKTTFQKKGEEIVKMNWNAVDKAGEALKEVSASKVKGFAEEKKISGDKFAEEVIGPAARLKGDSIPVSKVTVDGKVPLGTTKLEKRRISDEAAKWVPEKCIQCGICAFVCPHACIRTKQIDPKDLTNAPGSFKTLKSLTNNLRYAVQVYPEDCTGCTHCVKECPVKGKAIVMCGVEEKEIENAKFFDSLPDNTEGVRVETVRGSQLVQPLFEFSGACSGCGETPYIKLLTQLFGDRMIIANATGCSSIYGGYYPTIPYCTTKEGKGPAWANSLFEDNAEYGFGMRLAVDSLRSVLKQKVEEGLQGIKNKELNGLLKEALGSWDETGKDAVKRADRIKKLLPKESKINDLKDYFVDKSIWAIGGDGWAYDIGFGGLDHVLAQGKNINVLVLDTEGYSNTGGQASKATPLGATAKFAAAGKEVAKKNLGKMMMSYGYVYIASVNIANKNQVIRAMIEAEKYDGPSLIIAYSTCIIHGIDMKKGVEIQEKSVKSGYWPLYRYNPELARQGKDPFVWDSPEKSIEFKNYIMDEKRYIVLKNQFPERAKELFKKAEDAAEERTRTLKD